MKISTSTKNISVTVKDYIKKNMGSDKIPCFDLGLIRYSHAYKLQLDVFEMVKDDYAAGVILLLEHYPVITIGNNKNRQNLISSESILKEKNIELVQSNRGGDVTFHGPGQLVCYPVFNLQRLGRDLGRFVYNLEQIIIETLKKYEITGTRINGIRGVFVNKNKIASVGLHVRKWITLHGFSFNINVDLAYFENIVACGLKDHTQTSLNKIINKKIPISDVKELVLQNFIEVFDVELLK